MTVDKKVKEELDRILISFNIQVANVTSRVLLLLLTGVPIVNQCSLENRLICGITQRLKICRSGVKIKIKTLTFV